MVRNGSKCWPADWCVSIYCNFLFHFNWNINIYGRNDVGLVRLPRGANDGQITTANDNACGSSCKWTKCVNALFVLIEILSSCWDRPTGECDFAIFARRVLCAKNGRLLFRNEPQPICLQIIRINSTEKSNQNFTLPPVSHQTPTINNQSKWCRRRAHRNKRVLVSSRARRRRCSVHRRNHLFSFRKWKIEHDNQINNQLGRDFFPFNFRFGVCSPACAV